MTQLGSCRSLGTVCLSNKKYCFLKYEGLAFLVLCMYSHIMIAEFCNSCVEAQVLQITLGFKPFNEFVCEAEMLLSKVVF